MPFNAETVRSTQQATLLAFRCFAWHNDTWPKLLIDSSRRPTRWPNLLHSYRKMLFNSSGMFVLFSFPILQWWIRKSLSIGHKFRNYRNYITSFYLARLSESLLLFRGSKKWLKWLFLCKLRYCDSILWFLNVVCCFDQFRWILNR